ncbi:coiled-coil domain-containing protein 149 [Tetranychus urticae]|uniref:coiled-coil domain-containing protein 149 n=1 Tax=Tetranychus urticae TaxID=32264 RepID=UPI00077BC6F8|nr:coiled-coil domain-containing protein 149 [Tetranychus urticae]
MSNITVDNQSKQLQEAFNEISNLRCKLDSKSRASVILSQDLLECKRERDEYKLMYDQIKERYNALKRRIEGLGANFMGINEDPNNLTSASFAQILCQLNKQNKMLLYELEEVKTKLIDAEGDVRLLRGQINSMKRRPGLTGLHSNSISSNSSNSSCSTSSTTKGSSQKFELSEKEDKDILQSPDEGSNVQNLKSSAAAITVPISSNVLSNKERSEKHTLVTQLEMIKQRNCLLEKDMQSLLDEKEELIMIRDAYKAKVERLNGRLNNLLREQSGDPTNEKNDTKPIDIDSLINENNFLREKISQLEEEKKRLKALCTKYRNILEKSTPSSSSSMFSSLKSSSSDSRSKLLADHQALSNVISSKQVQAFIASNNLNNLQLSQATLVHLKSLVVALFESLTDKSSALALQRKNNRLLGERLEELEEKIKQLKAREKVFFLMKDNVNTELYNPEDLDDIIVHRPRDESRFSSSLPSPNPSADNNNNFHDNNETDTSYKEFNVDSEKIAENDDDEFQLPSNLKALVDGEVLKLKQNTDS